MICKNKKKNPKISADGGQSYEQPNVSLKSNEACADYCFASHIYLILLIFVEQKIKKIRLKFGLTNWMIF